VQEQQQWRRRRRQQQQDKAQEQRQQESSGGKSSGSRSSRAKGGHESLLRVYSPMAVLDPPASNWLPQAPKHPEMLGAAPNTHVTKRLF
jgi:hypothetical protein